MDSEKKSIIETPESTVIAEYPFQQKKYESFQSEHQLEQEFIKTLSEQGYEYLNINKEDDLIDNLKKQIEKLNNYKFGEEEWEFFFKTELSRPNLSIEDKTFLIQDTDGQILLKKKDGNHKNIKIIDKSNIYNNHLQVINQYETIGSQKNRYDVTILVNGLPLIHIELKRRGVELKQAFNQITRYQRESFWSDSGLFQYVQIFIISNGTLTKYYSNSTRNQYIKKIEQGARKSGLQTSNSYEFTSWWTDEKNKKIADLIDFTKTFLTKHTILNILTKYCVFTVDKRLMVMRPYQIVATEKILNRITIASNYPKKLGTPEAGGYIWHTTGSGKTLTSFKASQLATKLPQIDKVLFVVDRKDLDFQTINEYKKYKSDCVSSNKTTKVLEEQLNKQDNKIIVTTIQKLDKFIKSNNNHNLFNKQVVLIFDECHRSQFGEFHKRIIKNFNKYHIFGFTGTPIFVTNSSYNKENPSLSTTKQAFGDELHTYTIVDAIQDENVLPFKIDYLSTIKDGKDIKDIQVKAIDKNSAFMDARRISSNTEYIINNFDSKTYRNKYAYDVKEKRLNGFNSILCCESIEMAKKYYLEFQLQQKDIPENQRLKVATIFSYVPNSSSENYFLTDESLDDESVQKLLKSDREFLETAVNDYNKMFNSNFDVSSKNSNDQRKFENYFKDISRRTKERDLDILIVVNMFLTGFDATTLNTLWVDKQLSQHTLIQAFSRTNRILNSCKKFGNIVCFRPLEEEVNSAIALFGDKSEKGIIIIRTFPEYYYGYERNGTHIEGYIELVSKIRNEFPDPSQGIKGEEQEKYFIKLFNSIKKIINILNVFDEFNVLKTNNPISKELLKEREIQDYQSLYLELHQKYTQKSELNKENINDDVIFELDLIKQQEVGIDYILSLVEKIGEGVYDDSELIITINKSVDSSFLLKSKKLLIEQFIEEQRLGNGDWVQFINQKKKEELNQIIEEEKLNREKTYEYMTRCFKEGHIIEVGTSLDDIKPSMSFFDESYNLVESNILNRLQDFFKKYYDISDENIDDIFS